jgi:hypothetical protein
MVKCKEIQRICHTGLAEDHPEFQVRRNRIRRRGVIWSAAAPLQLSFSSLLLFVCSSSFMKLKNLPQQAVEGKRQQGCRSPGAQSRVWVR